MHARRSEILSSLIDKEIIGGLKESAPEKLVSKADEELLQKIAEEDSLPDELADEEDDLIKELVASSREMDALSEEESKLLETVIAEEGESETQVNEKIMSKVGVEKALEEGKASEEKAAGEEEKPAKPE
jgi:hypothetical protein